MKRRDFLKLVAIAPFGGLVLGKSHPLPSEQDYICAELQECSDYSTQSAAFIRHLGFWFFADQNIIKYCPENALKWDGWETIRIDSYDTFDFWQKIEGELCWVGEHEKWEILVNPDYNIMPVQIRWTGNWDGENWSDYKQ